MGRTFRVIGSSHPRVFYFFFFTNKIQLSDEVELAESEGPFKPCNKQTDLLYPQSTYDWLTKKIELVTQSVVRDQQGWHHLGAC